MGYMKQVLHGEHTNFRHHCTKISHPDNLAPVIYVHIMNIFKGIVLMLTGVFAIPLKIWQK